MTAAEQYAAEAKRVAAEVPVAFRPHPGPQTEAYFSLADELLYGGARGGGKTTIAVSKFLPFAAAYGPAAIGVIFRRNYPELDQVIEEGRTRLVNSGWAKWKEGKKTFEFWNGAQLKLRYIERLEDCEAYQGQQFIYEAFDEAGNFKDPRIFEKMRACLRSPHKEIRKQMMFTANPGGRQHHYLRSYFGIDRYPRGRVILKDPFGRTRLFVPAKLSDNPTISDTDYRRQLEAIKDPALRAAWLDGNWEVTLGSYFGDVMGQANVVKMTEMPPHHWPIYRSMDWGSAKPFAALWWTVTNEVDVWQGRVWPRGALVVVREWYGHDATEVDKGLGLTAEELGRGLQDREQRWFGGRSINAGPADSSMWNQDGGPSIYDRLSDATGGHIQFVKANKERIAGWEEMRTRLAGKRDTGPLLYFTSLCEHCLRTIPELVRSERDIEDVDDGQEDHCGDCVRYICNSHKLIPKREGFVQKRSAPTALDPVFGY